MVGRCGLTAPVVNSAWAEFDSAGCPVEVPVMVEKMVKVADAYKEVIPAGDRYGVRYSEAHQLDAALERRERKKFADRLEAAGI